jgi:hypothetical protein
MAATIIKLAFLFSALCLISVCAQVAYVSPADAEVLRQICFENKPTIFQWSKCATFTRDTFPCDANLGLTCDSNNRLIALKFTSFGLSGTLLPGIANLTSLVSLSLFDERQLSGSMPAYFATMPSLVNLTLYATGLKGPIPLEWGKFPALRSLVIINNPISGPIPPTLGNLKLTDLVLSNNWGIGGTIPADLCSISTLVSLDLSSNKHIGTIPAQLGDLSSLVKLDLSDNELVGPIPEGIGKATALSYINLNTNPLNCTIPPQLALPNLKHLDLNSDRLFGTIPIEFSALKSLHTFKVNANSKLTGQFAVPDSVDAADCDLQFTTICYTRGNGKSCQGKVCAPAARK